MKEWEGLAIWYDQKQGENGDLWHRALIDPSLIKLVGKVNGKNILDLGCGNGYLSRKFAKRGASVVAIDSNQRILELAKKRSKKGIRYLLSDAASLDLLEDCSFDLVFANMSLMDIENAKGAIAEVARVLKSNGRFVASLSHPCFDNCKPFSDWSREGRYTFRRIRRYRKPFKTKIYWDVGGKTKPTPAFHRPLSWYVGALKEADLCVTDLIEPGPQKEFIQKDKNGVSMLDVPLHLVFEARKYQS